MEHDRHLIERGFAQEGHKSPALQGMARDGMLAFLRQQITDAEWEIAKQRARIEAYETAIAAIAEFRASKEDAA